MPFCKLECIKFPDGELNLRFVEDVKGKDVFLVQNFQETKQLTLNDKLVETLLAIYTAKDIGARKVYLIAPYFPYFRSDKRFKKGQCVSIKVMEKLFAPCDKVFCTAPHLHRIKNMSKALKNGVEIWVEEPIIKYLKKKKLKEPLFVGPDIESLRWVRVVAKAFGQEPVVARKTRKSATEVIVTLPKLKSAKGREIVIIDDIISTGHTMLENISQLQKYKPQKFIVIGIHGIFAEGALPKLKKVALVASTNTISNRSEKIDVAGEIAKAVRENI